jgi:hypothetical protein
MTTLRQRLVRKKNRKLRRLRELYPDLNVKLFYARDFRALMLKYGKLALHEGLSGTSGQVAAPYGAPAVAIGLTDVPAPVASQPAIPDPPVGPARRRRRTSTEPAATTSDRPAAHA